MVMWPSSERAICARRYTVLSALSAFLDFRGFAICLLVDLHPGPPSFIFVCIWGSRARPRGVIGGDSIVSRPRNSDNRLSSALCSSLCFRSVHLRFKLTSDSLCSLVFGYSIFGQLAARGKTQNRG